MTVHIFNPDNDMALADGTAGYTPPATIRQMRSELWWLPNWWAHDDDIVWNGKDRLSLGESDEIRPWGWSPALIHRLKMAGVAEGLLPTDDEMERLRQLSHRQTAVEALRMQRDDRLLGESLVGDSHLCHTWEEAAHAMEQYPECVLKTPWSSSGKGIAFSSGNKIKEWCRNGIRRQGSIVVERRLDKLADFAMEFQCKGGGVAEYTGLSLFFTGPDGSYSGNWVAPENQKVQWLLQYVRPQHLIDIRHWWEEYLSHADYVGPVGVDMMLCRDGICPCVEINWRMTMGMVANLVAAQGRYGKLIVEYIYGHYSAEVEAFG